MPPPDQLRLTTEELQRYYELYLGSESSRVQGRTEHCSWPLSADWLPEMGKFLL